MKSIAIPPTGRIHGFDKRGADVAHDLLSHDTEVCICHHPNLPTRTIVMWVGGHSALGGHELNRRAWALYGGSPIFGLAVVAHDLGHDVDAVFEMVTDEAFPGAEIDQAMTDWLNEHAS